MQRWVLDGGDVEGMWVLWVMWCVCLGRWWRLCFFNFVYIGGHTEHTKVSYSTTFTLIGYEREVPRGGGGMSTFLLFFLSYRSVKKKKNKNTHTPLPPCLDARTYTPIQCQGEGLT